MKDIEYDLTNMRAVATNDGAFVCCVYGEYTTAEKAVKLCRRVAEGYKWTPAQPERVPEWFNGR